MRETNQVDLEGDEKLQRTVRLTGREYDIVKKVFGGVQRAFDESLKRAEEEEGWLPSLPKRMVPAFRAVRDLAITKVKQTADSSQLRDVVMNGCNCSRRTAVRYLHELKRRNLIYTFGATSDEHMHFVACSEFDHKTIMKINSGEKIDATEYFLEKYGV